ncbi:GNAT family N-acetyltransferase [Arsenicicoccus sp. UBA7492]|uniref:GNAT family N-acetyltransferase n=1 Tax=Arsenicicoccus sp. UBA7492 TaxID=1946057 RepID=UPI00257DCA3D|nr:GNAT family N-acetyltransferase [Arsenicicoccus sp. UBA7492]
MTTKPEAIIRPRRDDDLDELARILVQVHELDGYPVEGVADPHAWLTLTNPLGAWVAELNGKPVGHVALTEPGSHDDAPRMWSEQTGTPTERTAVLGRLFISPRARGLRLGRRLVGTAMDAATLANRVAVLDVMCKDRAAIRTYQAMGWKRLGAVDHQYGEDRSEPAEAYAVDVRIPSEQLGDLQASAPERWSL